MDGFGDDINIYIPFPKQAPIESRARADLLPSFDEEVGTYVDSGDGHRLPNNSEVAVSIWKIQVNSKKAFQTVPSCHCSL